MREYSFLREKREDSKSLGDVLTRAASEFGFNLSSFGFAFSPSQVRIMGYEPAPDRDYELQARISARIEEDPARKVEIYFIEVSDEVADGIVERIEDIRREK